MMEEKEVIEKIKKIIEIPLLKKNIEIVDIKWRRERGGWVLRIFIDKIATTKFTQVSIEDCAKVSNMISKILDEEDFIPHSYILEVSSPGINRPLTKKEHFDRFKGEKAKVTLKTPIDNRKNFTGIILGTEKEDTILMEVEGKVWKFLLGDIKKAVLQREIKF